MAAKVVAVCDGNGVAQWHKICSSVTRCGHDMSQVVQLFDSWAHHLSPEQFREFSLPYAQRVIAGVKALHPNTPLIFHANGGTDCSIAHI